MVMRAMRDSAKWVMLVLAVAFVGWLVFDWVSSRTAGAGADPNPVVGVVAGHEIRLADWNRYYEATRQQAQAQRPEPLNEEENRRVREAAWESMVGEILIEQELDRIGIEVADEEIRQAFRTNPPPEFLGHPAFQTDGRFDPRKYQAYFSSPTVDENLLLQMEAYYRDRLPRIKLERQVVSAVHVTEEEAWEWYRDRNETAEVQFVSVDPGSFIPDDSVTVTDEELRGHYRSHRDEFVRPATAVVDLVSLPGGPSSADSAVARARADSLRGAIAGGETTFEAAAREASADSATGAEGGDLGRLGAEDLVPPLAEAAFSVPVGSVSEPVATGVGLHLLRVDSRQGDSVSLRHILIPVEMSRATEDSLFDLIDDLEGRALDADLASAAEAMGLPVRRALALTRDSDFVPGAGSLGVAVDWAFDPANQLGDLSPFFENATGFHVVELKELHEAGAYPLEEVEPRIRARLVAENKREAARARLERAAEAIAGGETLEAVAARNDWTVDLAGAFSRIQFVPGLGRRTEAIGAAFGVPVGQTSGVLDAGDRLAILRVLSRTPADSAAFSEERDNIVRNLTFQWRQEYLQDWLAGLRERADVRDLRDQLAIQRAEQQAGL